ncbi:MAG: GGDEF domain-containing protein [Thermoanaerobaculia bacterium]|jgi:diguanylate cyclase (GGDEF)-like protein
MTAMHQEEELASRIARLARLGRARVFPKERFERELAAACDGIAKAEMLRLLLVEWTGVSVPAREIPRVWARVETSLRRFSRASAPGASLQTALLHEFHTRLGLLKEPRIVSDNEMSALRVNAITDPLTGLYNRRFLLDHLDREVSRAERAGGVVSVLMMDLAGFKKINDRLGHPVGDGILVRTAKAIRESLRVVDAGCRYGGDEFVAVLPNSDVVHSLAVAERIRQRVSGIRLPLRVGLRVGLNYGVATFPTDGRILDFLLKMSDIRLYASKRQNGKPFDHVRRYPRFAVPGLTLKVGSPDAKKPLDADVQDISYGGLAFVTGATKTPDRLQGEILQRSAGEPHAVAMRRISSVSLPDGRTRVGCAYVH